MKATTLTSDQLSELRQHLLSIHAILGIPSPVLSASSVNYTSKTKSELADLAGTTTRTFSKWIRPFRDELRQMGVTARTKLLPPQAVRLVCERLDIELPLE